MSSVYEYKVKEYHREMTEDEKTTMIQSFKGKVSIEGELQDRFKEEEVLKVEARGMQKKLKKRDTYVVSKLVRALIHKGQPSYEVQWKGYRKMSDNTIETRAILMEDIPKM